MPICSGRVIPTQVRQGGARESEAQQGVHRRRQGREQIFPVLLVLRVADEEGDKVQGGGGLVDA